MTAGEFAARGRIDWPVSALAGPGTQTDSERSKQSLRKNETRDPCQTKSKLGQLYWQHYVSVIRQVQPQLIGHVTTEVLEGIEEFTESNPGSPVANWHKEMMQTIGPGSTAGDPQIVSRFSGLYEQAYDAVFPATRAYLKIRRAVDEISSSHSLNAIDLAVLRGFDLEAHRTDTLRTFRQQLISRLNGITDADGYDVVVLSQLFEIYGEVVAYLFLRKRLKTARLAERKGKKTPDFECKLPDGKTFFVEVKSLDVVDGDWKNREMMEDALDKRVELQEQVNEGKPVATTITEIEPYRKHGETKTYDPRSLIRAIDTLREKSLQAFKTGQFEDGPTFALAITDRLLLPCGKFDLAPYYYAKGGIASGVLWHMAYGCLGTPIFRLPEFAGARSLEGHLDKFGLFTDETRPFPVPGLVVLDRRQCEHAAFGLSNDRYDRCGSWSIDDTETVLRALCDRWNDRDSSQSWEISADIGERHES